jgi:hypothetical protein
MRPFCYHNLSMTVSHHDWAFLMPRTMLERLLLLPREDYYECRADFPPGTLIEHWDVARWRAHGVGGVGDKRGPIQQHWAGVPAVVMRPEREGGRDTYCQHIDVAEQRPWEPDKRMLCRLLTQGNPFNREAVPGVDET